MERRKNMFARKRKSVVAVVVIVALALPALAITPFVGAQEEAAGIARVRIGYFAFDPWEIDTLIDGEPVPGGGWSEGAWLFLYPEQDRPYVIWCCSSTPFLNFPSGVHGFAFVPKGAGLDAAIFGPQEVAFEEGHRYSLAVVGEIEDDSLTLLVIDETEVFAEADPSVDYMVTWAHDIKGAPPVFFRSDGYMTATNPGYGQFATGWWPGKNQPRYLSVVTAGDRREQLIGFPTFPLPSGITALEAIIGSYPGAWGDDYSYVSNWWYVGEITVIDGGMVAVGDEISGEIAEIGYRVRHTLTLDASTTLNVYANATGPRTNDESGTTFDPMLYVYDAQGRSLFWNDEITYKDDSIYNDDPLNTTIGISDAGLEGIELTAGVYTIEVGGAFDFVAGPYELIVESAVSE
jgi:hypothetical protein